MAAFTSLAVGLLIGAAVGGTSAAVAAKRKADAAAKAAQAPAPSTAATSTNQAAATEPPDATKAASDAVKGAGQVAALRKRRPMAAGRAATTGAGVTAGAYTAPHTLIGA